MGVARDRIIYLTILAEDVGLAEDLDLLAVDLDVGAGVLAEKDLVPLDHADRARSRSRSLPGAGGAATGRAGASPSAVSGRTIPPAVFSSASICLITTRIFERTDLVR